MPLAIFHCVLEVWIVDGRDLVVQRLSHFSPGHLRPVFVVGALVRLYLCARENLLNVALDSSPNCELRVARLLNDANKALESAKFSLRFSRFL
jgi:hypothetical protein